MKKRPLFISLALLLFVACSKTDEEKLLTKFRKSIPYKTYRFASEKATELALAEYNKILDFPLQPHFVHATLGFLCLISGNSKHAYIETELAKESTSAETVILALGVQSVALSTLNCPHVAHEQFKRLKRTLALHQKNEATREEDIEVRLMFVGLIVVSLYQDDAELATFAAERLGTQTSFHYIPSVVSTLFEIKQGHTQKALDRLQKLSLDENIPESKRRRLSELTGELDHTPASPSERNAQVDRMILHALNIVIEDLFSNENQQRLFKKLASFSEEFTKGFLPLDTSETNRLENAATKE